VYYFLRNQNIKEGSLDLNPNKIVFIDEEYHEKKLKKSKIRKDDVLYTKIGTIGNSCIAPDIEANLNANLAIVRIRDKSIKNEFLMRLLNSEFYKRYSNCESMGSSQMAISLEKIKSLEIVIPEEEIIDKAVKLCKEIEFQAKEFELKVHESLVQANKILLDELGADLPEEEISYFFKEGRQDSSDYYYRFHEEIGDRFHYLFNHPKLNSLDILKNKYQIVPLKSICREPIKRGEQPEYSDFGVMVIKTVDLKNRFIDYENTLRVSEDFYDSKPQAHIQKNDILVTSTGYVSVGKIDVFNLDEPAFADGHISIVRLNMDYDTYFVTYFLRSVLGQLQFEKWFTGSSGQIEVQPEDLNKFLLPSKDAISKDKQKEIANKITEEYKRARDYEQRAQLKWQEAKELFEKLILDGVENEQKNRA
jgi:restriction endonuclease S subunit